MNIVWQNTMGSKCEAKADIGRNMFVELCARSTNEVVLYLGVKQNTIDEMFVNLCFSQRVVIFKTNNFAKAKEMSESWIEKFIAGQTDI